MHASPGASSHGSSRRLRPGGCAALKGGSALRTDGRQLPYRRRQQRKGEAMMALGGLARRRRRQQFGRLNGAKYGQDTLKAGQDGGAHVLRRPGSGSVIGHAQILQGRRPPCSAHQPSGLLLARSDQPLAIQRGTRCHRGLLAPPPRPDSGDGRARGEHERRHAGHDWALQNARRAEVTGMRAAAIAGARPPISPIRLAQATATPRRGGVIWTAKLKS